MKEEKENKACLLMCYKTKRKRGEKLACSPGSSQQDYGSSDRNSSVIVAQ
jgi:hypothetical protein